MAQVTRSSDKVQLKARWMKILPGFLLLLAAYGAAAQEAAVVRVDMVRNEPLLQTAPTIGRLVPEQSGMVSARVDGPIQEYSVQVGDHVRAGQAIAKLDRALLQAQRDAAYASVLEAEAILATQREELALAEQELRRLQRLRQSAAFSQARYDDQVRQVAISTSKLVESEGRIAVAKADLQLAETNLAYADIVAPYDGVITQRMSEAGAFVSAGQAIVEMLSDGQLEIEVDVPYQRIIGMIPGAEIEFLLGDGTRHTASVRAVIPDQNPRTETRPVRLIPLFNDIERPLAAGQSVTVLVPVGVPREILTVHKDAIVLQPGGAQVYVVEDDTVSPRVVATGEAVGNRLEVVRGLNEGDMVVTRGNERLRPGQAVRILDDDSEQEGSAAKDGGEQAG